MKYTLTLFISGLLLLSQPTHAQEMLINTVAGTGTFGFSGDGGVATAADLDGPQSIAVDKSGNIYFVDFYNNRVRKISASGNITTVAGNGLNGYSNAGTLATSVNLDPRGVAVDKYGTLYIATSENIIYKVNSAGIINVVAGLGTAGYAGDGGPATSALLDQPQGIAIDTFGNIFVADAFNNVIREINTAGIISTVAGNDTVGYFGDDSVATKAELDSPISVAVDYVGNLYISDYKNNVIRKVGIDDTVHTFAGIYGATPGYTGNNGPATAATLNGPAYIAVDSLGNLFIPDANNNVIREVNASSGIITTVAGNGSAGFGGDLGNALGANLHIPYGVAVDMYGSIYFSDANNQRVRKVYSATLAVKNVYVNANIDVYPNPSLGQVTVSGLDIADKVSVYDLLGRQIGSSWQVAAGGTQTFDITPLNTGVYLLQVNDANGNRKAVTRLVKE